MSAFFITGTDTNVGKTVVAALLMAYAKGLSSARYHKPLQTGIESDCDASTVRALALCTEEEADYGLAFKRPLSPHLAAAYECIEIDFLSVVQKAKAAMLADCSIIEGAGGIMVPINAQYLMVHLIKALAIPCIIVARSTLGTINHTLLTIEILRAHQIPIQGIVMVGEPNQDNQQSVATYAQISRVFSIPRMSSIDSVAIKAMAERKKDLFAQLLLPTELRPNNLSELERIRRR